MKNDTNKGLQDFEDWKELQKRAFKRVESVQINLRIICQKCFRLWHDDVFSLIDELKEMLLNTNWVIEETLEAPSDNQYIAILKQK